MKAITCTQCGALIKSISLKDKFAQCEYCGAKILLPEDKAKLIEIPDKVPNTEKKLTPYEQHQENYRKTAERVRQYDSPYHYPLPEDHSSWLPFLLAGIVIVPLIIVFASTRGCLSEPVEKVEKKPSTTGRTFKIEFPSPTAVPTIPPTPHPQLNYEVKVQWSGNYDMEHFEQPEIDESKLPSFDEKELKKTVFKNRSAKVRITIGTDGEVTKAEAISGHPLLKEAALEAARKTLFNPRKKPTTRVLTYYFRLLSE